MTDADQRPAVAGQVERPVRPVAAHMLTEDGSRHHLRFDVREVERTSNRMQQRCVMLYEQAAIDAAVAAERERLCAAIKAADDAASDGNYMLDSDDCIRVIRGTWNPGA